MELVMTSSVGLLLTSTGLRVICDAHCKIDAPAADCVEQQMWTFWHALNIFDAPERTSTA